MMTEPPTYLYKYMSKRLDRIGDVLVNRRLHFASPIRFNDPFDCAPGLDLRHGATDEDWTDYFVHLVQEYEPNSTPEYRQAKAKDNINRQRHTDPAFLDETEMEIRNAVKTSGHEQGVVCLSSDLESPMMWAHYADNHQGLVLRFDSSHMTDQTSGELRCFKANYTRSFPQLPEYLAALRAFNEGDATAFTKLFFCRKSTEWEYEKEWRFFAGKPDSFVEFDPPMLSAIIFGWKMSEGTRQLVAAWAASLNPQPKLLQAEPCVDRFRMNVTTITT